MRNQAGRARSDLTFASVSPSPLFAPAPYTALNASRSSSSSIGSPPPADCVEEDTVERSGTAFPSFSTRWSIAGCNPRLLVAFNAPTHKMSQKSKNSSRIPNTIREFKKITLTVDPARVESHA